MAEEEEKQDLLYFGSVPVRFGRVDGSAFRYQHNRSFELPEGGHASNEAAAFVCKKEDGRDLVLPDIPAFAPCLKLSEPLNEEDAVEAFFCRPLLKEEGGSIEGIQSGRRSALIKVENRWFRLKGCGDLYGGFPLRTMKTSDLPKELRERLEKDKDTVSTFVEIRGCMFAHTSSRELFMSAHIEELLRPLGIPVANTPFGWWEYSLPEEPFASVKRTCAIYECLGEKRLGDHVLVGLERLLPLLVAPEKVGPTLLALFPPSRLQEDVTGGVMETWMHVLMDGPDEELVDCVLLPIERADILEDTLEQFIVSAGVSTLFLETWKDASTQLVAHLNELNSSSTSAESMSLLAYLFWRVGREAGQIQRVLRDNDISWGTYVDSLGTHCNSHPNNLVLLPHEKSNEAGRFLAPLDFDMAYTRCTFTKGETTFGEWMVMEDKALKMALAGDQALNSGMTGIAELESNYLVIKWALRDTMVKGFASGFEKREDAHPFQPQVSNAAYALLKMALIFSSNDIA